jgi:Carboxypeptidase regulatory-like domain/TonB dependent receptor
MKRLVVAVFLFLSVLSATTFAQTTNATLGGTVSDSTRALIPGVSVTAANTQTGIVTTVVTNETGAYQFASLQTGTYKVTAELPGFQTQTYNAVTLGVAQQVRLNFTLQVGAQTQAIEVSVAADTLIATTSSSVGAVLPEYKLRDLPLASRNALDLVATTAGTQGGAFAGSRTVGVNTVRDGVPVSDGRYDVGVSASTYVSPDLVDEVRVIVAPADAELGRGSGQVQMATRSGTNQFRGSLFWQNRNSALSANSWFNNFRGVGKDYRNANQFGGRIGGPIIKNKTFFFFLWEGQRYITKQQFSGNVLTKEAREGIFRFFPGVQNANFFSNSPVVDQFGNPVTPQGVNTSIDGGRLQSVSVFGKDPIRPGFDSSGWVQRLISRMPLPNDFTVGDGLNTAGHRWLRRVQGQDTSVGDGQDTNRNQTNIRIDHNFNSAHKVNFSGTWEKDWSMTTQTGISNWPGGYDGLVQRDPRFYQAGLISTISPTVLNEFRFGLRRNKHYAWNPIQRPDEVGDEARKNLVSKNGELFLPTHILFTDNIFIPAGQTRGQTSPIYTFTDTMSWTRGKHAFKGGFEARFTASNGFNFGDDPKTLFPSVTIGQSGPSITGISTIPGITGNNVNTAQNLLLDLSGSVSNVSRTFYIQSPSDKEYTGLVQMPRDNHQNEWGAFFKDDWKIRPDLTLNVGARYDFYGVPYESHGLNAMPIGGNAAMFGLSGNNSQWVPGASGGSLTTLQFAGKHSPNPDALWYKNDWNNIAPAVGFSWSVPYFGKDKTVLRAGYGISYQGAANYNAGWNYSNPNASSIGQNFTRLGLAAQYFNLTTLPIPVPPPGPSVAPLAVEPVTQRTAALRASDENRVIPYVQTWNLEIQRSLASNLTLEARYIASKGTKLLVGIPLNDVNIFENKFLEAFNMTRVGGDAPMFDQMLRGLAINAGQPVGQNGVTGSAALRQNTQTRGFLANGDVGQLADFLNRNTLVTGQGGGLLRNSGLFPENFFAVNPQFASVRLDANASNSTYHSMQLQVTKRLSSGFTNQTSWTWSKSIGEGSDDGGQTYLNPRDRSLNKTLLAFDRRHSILSNGTYELPFGPGRPFLSGAPRFVTRLVEQWQLGGIFNWTSGAPVTITATTASFIQATGNTPVVVGDFPKNAGKVTPDSSGGTYFPGFKQEIDTATRNSVTTLQSLQAQFSNQIIKDAQGNPVLINPAPGQLGTLGQQWIAAPAIIGLDVNLVKRIRIDESKNFEIRVDVVNLLNTPRWSLVTGANDINNLNFGRISAADPTGSFAQADTATAARRFSLNARFSF